MLKYTFLLGILCFGILACNKPTAINHKVQLQKNVKIDLVYQGSTPIDSLSLFAWDAIQASEMTKIPGAKNTNGQTTFSYTLRNPHIGLYYIGPNLRNIKPLFIGPEKELRVEIESDDFKMGKIPTSTVNQQYEALLQQIEKEKNLYDNLVFKYQNARGNSNAQKAIEGDFAILNLRKKNRVDSLQKVQSPLAPIASLYAYQSYQSNRQVGLTEGSYLAKNYFALCNLSDTTLSKVPFFYEVLKNYPLSLGQLKISYVEQEKYLDSLLALAAYPNPNHEVMTVAFAFSMTAKSSKLFKKYAKQYLQYHREKNTYIDQFFTQQIKQMSASSNVGEEAPEIEGNSPSGEQISLSSMRGKYVLIDFWASWCGPCRRENPNVVRLYQKYKDKGFEILGVSLDSKKANWKAAIKKDQLTWPQISDLKGWNSAFGKLYGVRGIPHTVLVDPQGKIIAKKLRGIALEKKLEQVLK